MNRRVLAIAAAAAIAVAAPAVAEPGRFLHVADIHFNPFDPSLRAKELTAAAVADWHAIFAADPDQTFARYGEDTNHALYDSSLIAIGMAGVDADFVVMTGDVLVHRFQDNAESVLGFVRGSAANDAFAVRTTLYVLGRLRQALPGKPIFVALGNNDSSCGDYRIDPGGSYLAATREAIRDLVEPISSPMTSMRPGSPVATTPPAIRPSPVPPSWSSTTSCGRTNTRMPAARAVSTPPMP